MSFFCHNALRMSGFTPSRRVKRFMPTTRLAFVIALCASFLAVQSVYNEAEARRGFGRGLGVGLGIGLGVLLLNEAAKSNQRTGERRYYSTPRSRRTYRTRSYSHSTPAYTKRGKKYYSSRKTGSKSVAAIEPKEPQGVAPVGQQAAPGGVAPLGAAAVPGIAMVQPLQPLSPMQPNTGMGMQTLGQAQQFPAYSQQNLEIQTSLNKAGYAAGPEDGVYGEPMRQAIMRFQTANGYQANGMLTPDQLQTLYGLAASAGRGPHNPLVPGMPAQAFGGPITAEEIPSFSQQVLDMQRSLNRAGFSSGEENGLLNPQTKQAIVRFQNQSGYSPTGFLTPDQLQSLHALGGGLRGQSPQPQPAIRHTYKPSSGPSQDYADLPPVQNPVLKPQEETGTIQKSRTDGSGLEERIKIETALIALNLMKGEADGKFTAETEAAIKDFQGKLGNAQTGKITDDEKDELFVNASPYMKN
jgi:peptidoglycan hydrolase-like protein with peptidoglycan-binding domain